MSLDPERNRLLVPLLLSWGQAMARFDIDMYWIDTRDHAFQPIGKAAIPGQVGPGLTDDDIIRLLKWANCMFVDYLETLIEGNPPVRLIEEEILMRNLGPEGPQRFTAWQRNLVSKYSPPSTVTEKLTCQLWPIDADCRKVTEREGKTVEPAKLDYSVLWGITQDGGCAFLPNGDGVRFTAASGEFETFRGFPRDTKFQWVCWGFAPGGGTSAAPPKTACS
jgi:hypothetical protein